MAAERDLGRLLARLDPVLHPEVLVWAVLPAGAEVPASGVFARVEEDEGTTVVVTEAAAAQAGLDAAFRCRRIELRVHSALEAVGLTAAVSRALADAGLTANVVAGAHHDHLLVAAATADAALAVLRDLPGPSPP